MQNAVPTLRLSLEVWSRICCALLGTMNWCTWHSSLGQLHVLWSLKVAGTVEFGVGGNGASALEAAGTLVLDVRVKLLLVSGAIVVPVCIVSAH